MRCRSDSSICRRIRRRTASTHAEGARTTCGAVDVRRRRAGGVAVRGATVRPRRRGGVVEDDGVPLGGVSTVGRMRRTPPTEVWWERRAL